MADVPTSYLEHTQRDYARQVEHLAESLEALAVKVRRYGKASPRLREPSTTDYIGSACDILKEMDWAVANMNIYRIVQAARDAEAAEREAAS